MSMFSLALLALETGQKFAIGGGGVVVVGGAGTAVHRSVTSTSAQLTSFFQAAVTAHPKEAFDVAHHVIKAIDEAVVAHAAAAAARVPTPSQANLAATLSKNYQLSTHAATALATKAVPLSELKKIWDPKLKAAP